ncbi:hypothetical protein ACFX5K_04175 [Rickettsiales bacterium LUAb2]
MRTKIIIFIIFLTTIIPLNVMAAEKYITRDEKTLYSLIVTAYDKESTIYNEFRYVNKKFNSNFNLSEIINRHKKNMSLLANIMQQYDISIPDTSKPLTIDIKSREQVCEEGLLMEQELSSFYNDSVNTLTRLQPTETTGTIIATFNTLGDNSFFENSAFFKSCAKRVKG